MYSQKLPYCTSIVFLRALITMLRLIHCISSVWETWCSFMPEAPRHKHSMTTLAL
ncbi:uncharacterized protein BDV14DRAFT_176797 [Aspergillus stella-maris]|uniref:uncharacterized protein n=1 Tax=Aspergillus stella-maris TaxID=1810926 RepID=UPI003CCD82A9